VVRGVAGGWGAGVFDGGAPSFPPEPADEEMDGGRSCSTICSISAVVIATAPSMAGFFTIAWMALASELNTFDVVGLLFLILVMSMSNGDARDVGLKRATVQGDLAGVREASVDIPSNLVGEAFLVSPGGVPGNAALALSDESSTPTKKLSTLTSIS
jgi:hypothetical protein